MLHIFSSGRRVCILMLILLRYKYKYLMINSVYLDLGMVNQPTLHSFLNWQLKGKFIIIVSSIFVPPKICSILFKSENNLIVKILLFLFLYVETEICI